MPIIVEAPAPPVTGRISMRGWMERITDAEWVDIELAMQHDPAGTNADKRKAARLRVKMRRLSLYSGQRLNIAANWLQNFVDQLVADGLLSAQRAVEVMDPNILPREET